MALGGLLGGSVFAGLPGGAAKPMPPPPGVASGFDAIVQCSQILLQQTQAFNLSQRGLNPISLRVPYHPELVTPGVRTAIQPNVRPTDFLHGGVFLEVVLQDPVVQTLNWPAPSEVGSGPGGTGTQVAAAIVGPPRRTVGLTWTAQLNIFKPDSTAGTTDRPAPGASVVGGIGAGAAGGAASGASQGSPASQPSLPAGFRLTITQGTATMTVPAELLVFAPVYRFRLSLNFEGVRPVYESPDPILAEFLKTGYATSLMAQTIGPLLNQADIGLSPTMALGGGLTANQLAAQGAPALTVLDRLVPEDQGQALSLCVSLGGDTGGALDLVRSFLFGSHFAYYVSDKVFVPVLKGLWRANAVHTPIVGDVSVEMPVEQGSDQTGSGQARLQVNLSDTLLDASLQASTDDNLGDPLLLTSQQTIKLLALTDPSGNQVQDLGSLGQPAVEPLVLGLFLFDNLPGGGQQQINPAVSQLVAALLLPIYLPIVEPLPLTGLNGYSSSPLRAALIRWNLDVSTGPFRGAGGQISGT